MTAPSADKFTAKAYLAFGATQGQEKILLDKSVETSSGGNRWLNIPLELAASATDTQLNLATYVDTATWIAVEEVSTGTTGFNINIASANKQQVAAEGVWLYKNRNATPPTLYIDNPDGSNKIMLNVAVLGNSA